MYMHYPACSKEMEMTEILEFTKDELVNIILRSLQKGDSILAETIDTKLLEKKPSTPEKPMQSIMDRAFSKIVSECSSYNARIRGYGYWDYEFEHVQEEMGSELEDNVRKVVENGIRTGCTEPVFKFIDDVKKLLDSHYDDYYFFWITDSLDEFFEEMEDTLRKGIIPR